MERYPLQVSIPRAELLRKPLGFRHTEYLIQVDDCGKVYERLRRFSSFVWLHGELRRRELACALPELPPKKAVGKLEALFVERRRQMLEEYLTALLKLAAVVQDDSIWTFLDADVATAVVPRFLCRPASYTATHDLLLALEKVVKAPNQVNLFRFCTPSAQGEAPAVPAALVAFAQAEADEPLVDLGPQAHQVLQARLNSRQRFCSAIQVLISHERSRNALIEAGMFGALLQLLWRVTEDGEAAGSDPRPCDTGESHRRTTYLVNLCLSQLLEASRGVALLHFCQNDDGLGALWRIASSKITALHPVAASLLWHGLQSSGVVTVLVAASATDSDMRGLRLLGKLLKSPDLRARLLAGLCVACVVRQEGALSPEHREFCLEALVEIPRDLDAAEVEAVNNAANASLERHHRSAASDDGVSTPRLRSLGQAYSDGGYSSLHSPERLEGGVVVEPAASVCSAVHSERNPGLAGLLRSLCSARELPRQKALLGDPDAGIDSVTSLVVALLDHFVRQCQEPARLKELNVLAPQLHRLLDLDDSPTGHQERGRATTERGSAGARARRSQDWGVEGGYTQGRGVGASSADSIRVRAARLLVRLDYWTSSAGEATGGEPPSLAVLHHRARVLYVLTSHSEATQEEAARRLVLSADRGRRQLGRVDAGHLTEAPCLTEARLAEIARDVALMADRRAALASQLDVSRRAVEAGRERLERRRVKHRVLHEEVDEVARKILSQSEQEERCEEVCAVVREYEEQLRAASAEAEQALSRDREAAALVEEREKTAREAETRAVMLTSREQELAEVCHNAPAQIERLQAQLQVLAHTSMKRAEKAHRLAAEAEHTERRSIALRDAEREADDALKKVSTMRGDLQAFQQTLQSELVLSDEQLSELRQFELALQPARPSRLRKAKAVADPETAAGDGADTAFDCSMALERWCEDTADAPNWDDERSAEQEVRAAFHFRSFFKLCVERERLWSAERLWLQDVAGRVEATAGQLERERQDHDAEERRSIEEQQQLQREVAALEDHEGHRQRHAEARIAAAEARELVDGTASQAAEAVGTKHQAEVALEKCNAELQRRESALTQAREAEAREAALSARVRSELDGRGSELETKMRSYIDEWKAVELQERKILLLQERVQERLAEETQARHALRTNAGQLVELLHELDRQLDVDLPDDSFDSPGSMLDVASSRCAWIPESAQDEHGALGDMGYA